MKKTILVFLVLVNIFSCKSQTSNNSVWTAAYTEKNYKQIDNEMKQRLPDDDKRKQLVTFIIKRFKAELPKGLESVSADSLRKLSVKIGKEYAYAHADGKYDTGLIPTPVPWTKEIEQTFKEAFLKDWAADDLENGKKFCDCAINVLKKIYPDSVIMPFPHDAILQAAKECQKKD